MYTPQRKIIFNPKNHAIMKKLLLFSFLLLTLFSCNKTELNSPELGEKQSIQNYDYRKGGGVLPDPPELKKNFSMKISQEFLEHGRTLAFNKNGKKIVDMRADEAEFLMKGTAAKGSTKGGGWGQGGNPGSGGSTGGSTGGGGTTQTDWTAPRIVGIDPVNGQVYNLSLNSYVVLNALVDDETALARVKVTIRGDVIIDTAGPFKQGYGNWNYISQTYQFPYGDGTYNMTWQAWDAAGNTTIVNTVFSRNTEFSTIPVQLPTSFILPYPKQNQYIHQGGEGACAAFAVNSAFTIQKYVRGGLTGGYNDNNVYSPEWIYNIALRGAGCGSGSSVLGNMGTVVNRGVPTWAALPFSYMNGCDTLMFTQAIRDNAALNKGLWGFSTPTADINALKYNITRGYVGIHGFQLDHQLTSNVAPNYIWNFPHFQDGGPHAGCIIGYDDSKHAFLMLNSWGNTWANEGAVWIDYDFFWQAVTGALYYFGN